MRQAIQNRHVEYFIIPFRQTVYGCHNFLIRNCLLGSVAIFQYGTKFILYIRQGNEIVSLTFLLIFQYKVSGDTCKPLAKPMSIL